RDLMDFERMRTIEIASLRELPHRAPARDDEMDGLEGAQRAHEVRVALGDAIPHSGPGRFVMRPREPGRAMRLPLGGPPSLGADHGESGLPPRNREVMPRYASMRRSRRKGQSQRVRSMRERSHSATRTSLSLVDPRASTRPKGSQM